MSEGDGFVSLGANNLTIGSNNLSTKFSGAIGGRGRFADQDRHRHARSHWGQYL